MGKRRSDGLLNVAFKQIFGTDFRPEKKQRSKSGGGPKLNVKNVFYNSEPHGIFFSGKYYKVEKK